MNTSALAEENIIRNNSYSGHTEADAIVVGLKTVVDEGEDAKVIDDRYDPAEREQ